MTSATQPKWINDPLTAAIGRIVMLEERVVRQDARIRFLEERLAQLSRPQALLTEKEAAAMLKMHPDTLKGWRKERPAPRIPFILFEGGDVRYRAEEIERYLKSRERGAPPTKRGTA